MKDKPERRSSSGKAVVSSRGAPAIAGASALLVIVVAVRGAGVPPSPFLGFAYRYADAMLEHGRDIHGPKKTGLFLGTLGRTTQAPLAHRPPAPPGVTEDERAGPREGLLTGANPQHDENLLRLLYVLSGLSGSPHYGEAADAGMKWFLENAASPGTGLLPWGKGMCWDAFEDHAIPREGDPSRKATHEFARPWVLWDRCFELAPEASKRFALGLWKHQIADQRTGAFDRRAGFWEHAPQEGMDSPRHAGFYIRTWAVAHARTGDEVFLKAIAVLLERFEGKRHPKTGLIEGRSGHPVCSPAQTLSLAIDCDAAARRVGEPLASRLRAFAGREDDVFCGLPHDLTGKGGFVAALRKDTGKPVDSYTSLWEAPRERPTTAQVAMMCVARYENTGKIGYRELITDAADAYRRAAPGDDQGAWPMTFGHAISLELAAWRSSARRVYLEHARLLADLAVKRFWPGESALPRASAGLDGEAGHYEAITGADSLALALVELHLTILGITAVPCPSNTIDR